MGVVVDFPRVEGDVEDEGQSMIAGSSAGRAV